MAACAGSYGARGALANTLLADFDLRIQLATAGNVGNSKGGDSTFSEERQFHSSLGRCRASDAPSQRRISAGRHLNLQRSKRRRIVGGADGGHPPDIAGNGGQQFNIARELGQGLFAHRGNQSAFARKLVNLTNRGMTIADPGGELRRDRVPHQRIKMLHDVARFAPRHIDFVIRQHGIERGVHDQQWHAFGDDVLDGRLRAVRQAPCPFQQARRR